MATKARKVPAVIMRGGTSRGPYFLADDLPEDVATRDRVLTAVMGSGNILQVDGIGGGNPLTSKVAIVSKSSQPGADVDYLFAQVDIGKQLVDTKPNCGNMLAGVGPFAIEAGLVPVQGDETPVRIFNVNTESLITAYIQTPGGQVRYDGDFAIDGVPGTAAPIRLVFSEAAGAVTGALLPAGAMNHVIDGVTVSLVDYARPIMLLRAADVGLRGDETPEALDADRALLARLEAMRLKAGLLMGLGDVSNSVVPKVAL
ncbi:MAG: PrpF domain-containing protein, partial [Beijerinckiaceae bacterium]